MNYRGNLLQFMQVVILILEYNLFNSKNKYKYIFMTFYSQCEEDKYMYENYFKNKRNGFYIELGALDGVLYSNTKFFEDSLDWRGILIEPHPDKFKMLMENRPNNFLFNDLVSCYIEPQKFRYFCDINAAVSGVENTLSDHHFETYFDNEDEWLKSLPQNCEIISPRTLTEIVKSTKVKHIDFMSLDVEGHEYEVLKSWDFSIPIDIILIEMLGVQPEREELCRQYLKVHNYKYLESFKHNEVFCRIGAKGYF